MPQHPVWLGLLIAAPWLAIGGTLLIAWGLPPGLDPGELTAGGALLAAARLAGDIAWKELA